MTDAPDAGTVGRRVGRQRADTTRRLPAVVAVVLAVGGVVAAGTTVDGRDGAVATATVAAGGLAPVAPAEDALGSTWYCAAGTADEGGAANHSVFITNVSDEPVDVTITVVPGGPIGEAPESEPVVEERTVGARSTEVVVVRQLLVAPVAAAIVEAGRGEVAVEHALTNAADLDFAPCASSSSAEWHVAASDTTRDATAELYLFNPFPDDAVVDVTFATPEGLRSPPAFTGLIVPARRVSVIDIGSVVSRHENVATSVVARSGRLVVERVQRFDGSEGAAGLAVTPGAPAPALLWYFPEGLFSDGLTEVVTVFNPTDDPAEVDVEVDLDPPPADDPGAPVAAAPYQQTIAPHSYAQVVLSDAADGRVPAGRTHSVAVRSQNGVPVVAERWLRSGPPAARTGFAATLGSPVVATRWLASAGGADGDTLAEYLVLVNPAADGIARVRIAVVTPSQLLPVDGLQDVEVPAQGRVALDLGSYINRAELPLVVTATEPIVVERGLYPSAGGVSSVVLLPSAPTATVPDVDLGAVVVP